MSFQPKISEAEFQRQVSKIARMYNWLVDHTPPMRNAGGDIYTGGLTGKTDLLLISLNAKGIIFAELKTETGRLSVAQVAFRDAIVRNGGEHFVWRPSDMPAIIERLSR